MQGGTDRIGHAVLPLQVVDGVDAAGRRDEVTAEGAGDPVDLDQEGDRATRVAGRGLHPDAVAAPLERLVIDQSPRHRDRSRQRVPQRRGVVVVELTTQPPERLGLREQCSLARRHRDLRAVLHQPRIALALVAVVMGVEHPLDLLDADLGEMVEDGARPGVDEQAGLAVAQQEDVAGVAEPEQVRRDGLEPPARRAAHATVCRAARPALPGRPSAAHPATRVVVETPASPRLSSTRWAPLGSPPDSRSSAV